MNHQKSQRSPVLNKLFFSLLHKIIQQPDFYPIKHYYKRKRAKDLGQL